MKVPRNGLVVALALAGAVAVGAAGSTIAASPSAGPATGTVWAQMGQMMGGSNLAWMMGSAGASFGPGMMGAGSSFAAGMMGNLGDTDRAAVLAQCDEIHDSMHVTGAAAPSATGASTTAASTPPSLHDFHHPRP